MIYDADNRLLTYNGQQVEYDKEGNMTRGPLNGGMADFAYDCRNRLVKVTEQSHFMSMMRKMSEQLLYPKAYEQNIQPTGKAFTARPL